MAEEPSWLKQFEKVGPAAPQGAAKPVQSSGGEVFIPSPGAAEEARRREEAAALDVARTGVTLEGGARAGREEVRGAARELRDAFEKQKVVQDYQTALPAYTSILDLAAKPANKANDFTIITMFNKVQDPGSAVLEGERAAAQNVSTLFEKYKAQLQGLFDPETGFVSDDARRQFVQAVHTLIGERKRAYDATRNRYAEIAQQPEYGVRPELVVGRHFGEQFYQPIVEAWPKIFPDAGKQPEGGAAPPPLQVAQGETFSTDQDIAIATELNSLWKGGATVEQLNQRSIELTGKPFPAETLQILQEKGRAVNIVPASSGRREAGGPGPLAAIGAGLLRGATANLGEEAIGMIDPTAAAKLQAASEYAQEEFPVTGIGSELVGGVLSPLARVGNLARGAGPIMREAISGATYGTLYGAGEADPNAGLVERLPGALLGGVTGGAGGAAGGALAQRLGARGGPGGGGAADEAAPTAIIPPAPSQLNKPRTPTATEMKRFSSVQNVDLSNARRGQDVYDWTANKAGDYAEPLIEGYGDIPVGVRLENGEVVVFDGNHRVALALGKNQREMPMHVIDAKNFDPENMGRKPVSPRQEMSDEELLAELGVPVTPAIDNIVPGAIGEVPTPAASDMEMVVDLARKATGRGPGRSAARRELAKMAKVNPAAQEAADRLGITLPPDVLSDDAQLLSLTGLARSQVGSEAEAAWQRTARDAIQRSDTVMDELGATTDLAQLSSDVSTRLSASMDDLQKQASALRDEVSASFKPSDMMDATNTKAALANIVEELGGPEKAKAAMSAQEKKLLGMLMGKDGMQSYALIDRVRRDMGKALYEKAGPFVDADSRTLMQLERALAEDQLAFIERVGGKELADKQRAANSLFGEMYAKRDELQNLFGKDLSASVVPLIRRAITSGAKGDIQALNKVVSNVPEDMRGKVLMSGLLAESTGRGAYGGFSFANFAKTYRGLRANGPVYKEFVKYIGQQGDQTLIDLYAISRRMVEAENKVLKTGKANQAMIGQMNAESLLGKVAASAGGRAVANVGTGAVAGPVMAGGMALAGELASRAGGATRTDKLHKLLVSDEFRSTMEKLAAGGSTESAANRLAGSKAFVDFAKRLPIPQNFKSRAEWIKTAFAQAGGNMAPEAPTVSPEPIQ